MERRGEERKEKERRDGNEESMAGKGDWEAGPEAREAAAASGSKRSDPFAAVCGEREGWQQRAQALMEGSGMELKREGTAAVGNQQEQKEGLSTTDCGKAALSADCTTIELCQ